MRLFVAVPLPDDIAMVAAACLPDLPGVRKVRPELMHITLAFLGSVDQARLPDAIAAVSAAARGRPAFEVLLSGIDRFPSDGAPRIVWLGIARGAAELIRLADALRADLAARSLPFDPKPFRAHLTIARVGDLADRSATRALVSAIEGARMHDLSFRAERVELVESVISSKGPRYTARATVSLEVGEKRESARARRHP